MGKENGSRCFGINRNSTKTLPSRNLTLKLINFLGIWRRRGKPCKRSWWNLAGTWKACRTWSGCLCWGTWKARVRQKAYYFTGNAKELLSSSTVSIPTQIFKLYIRTLDANFIICIKTFATRSSLQMLRIFSTWSPRKVLRHFMWEKLSKPGKYLQ